MNKDKSMETKYLFFKIQEENFIMDISKVHSVIVKEASEIRRVPDAPKWVMGITSIRESVAVVVDGRILFNKPAQMLEKYKVILLRDEDDSNCGIVVDDVSGVINDDSENIQSKDNSFLKASLAEGVLLKGDDMYLLIDPVRIISLVSENKLNKT